MFDSFGLDISDLSIKYVYLKTHLFGLSLSTFGEIRVPEGAMKDGEIKNKEQTVLCLRQILLDKKLTTRFANVSLPDSKTFIKLVDVPISDEGEQKPESFKEPLLNELANHIPLPVDELTLDWQRVEDTHVKGTFSKKMKETGPVKVLVAASETKTVQEFTSLLRESGFMPQALEVEAQAILRATVTLSEFNSKSDGATVLIDLGQTQTNVIFIERGAILFTNSLSLSGQEITRKIAEKLSFSLDQAEKAKIICGLNPKKCKGVVKTYLENHVNALAQAIQKSREFYEMHFNKRGIIRRVILVGGGANLKDLDTSLEPLIGIRPEYGNVFTNLPARTSHRNTIPAHHMMSYATAIGLAMRDL